MPRRPDFNGRTLREACLDEAVAIIAESGIESLSLRDVARRLGVSHQAPYKHFPSRDHLLAEVVRSAFDTFAAHLDARPRGATAEADLAALGQAYLAYALAHPLAYRLMFGTRLPDVAAHPAMLHSARHAFALLREALGRMRAEQGARPEPGAMELDALFIWTSLHGLASALQTSAMATLALPPAVLAATLSHTLQRIGAALTAPVPQA